MNVELYIIIIIIIDKYYILWELWGDKIYYHYDW